VSALAGSPGGGGDRIELKGLRATGTHGVLDEEKTRAQPFEVDLVLEADLRSAGLTDALEDTADYGAVAEAAVAVVAGRHADLLETLAARIAAAALAAAPNVGAVTVSVRKMRPPVPLQMESAGVTIRRTRPEGPGGRSLAGPGAG
jgi:dihydroneopterin aldolase/2-amino-4-hydroxy-6-hydroxymethyldihydropteridine diphosphokinase